MPKLTKLAIDTNLWISFAIGKRLQRLRELFRDENILIVCCERSIEEFLEVSSRDSMKKYIDEEAASETLELIRRYAIKVDIKNTVVQGLNDPKDSFLFALADAANVNFILTGDKHLLSLVRHNNTAIISFSDFLRWYYET